MADAAWYANTVAVVAVCISAGALAVSIISILYSRGQTKAAERQAAASEHTARLQAEALKVQAKDTEQALSLAKANLGHSEKLAEAAQQSATATKYLAEAGQRAWVGVRKFAMHRQTQTIPTSAVVTIENFGRTPARNLRITQDYLLADDPNNYRVEILFPDKASKGPLAPSVFFDHPVLIRLDTDQIKAVVNRSKYLVVYGKLIYVDIFEQQRATRWSFYYDVAVQDYALCSINNDAD